MPFIHLAWFFGVLTVIFFIYVLVFIGLSQTEDARDDTVLHVVIGSVLFLMTLAPEVYFIKQVFRRKKPSSDGAPAQLVADLSRGMLTGGNGDLVWSLAEVDVRVKSAWDTYLAADDHTFYYDVELRWGRRKKSVVFKTEHEEKAGEIAEFLIDSFRS